MQRYSARQEKVHDPRIISIHLNSEIREDVSLQNKIIRTTRRNKRRERDEKIGRDGSIIRKDVQAEGRYRER